MLNGVCELGRTRVHVTTMTLGPHLTRNLNFNFQRRLINNHRYLHLFVVELTPDAIELCRRFAATSILSPLPRRPSPVFPFVRPKEG